MKMEFNETEILQGLDLLARAGWSTTATEQGHSSSGCLMKLHKMYGARTMQDRACVMAASPLFSKTNFERKLFALERRLASLDRRRPNYLTGRQLFLRELNYTANRMRLEGKNFKPDFRKGIMIDHGKLWQRVP